jgi:uncharacterized membrane protein YqiK
MDPVAGAKAAASTLRGAQAAGKELGSVVTSQQADMEAAVQQQHKARMQAKLAEQRHLAMAEFRAVERYEAQKAHQREVERIKQDVIRKHGKNAWTEVEAVKAKMERDREQELKYMDKDRARQIQVFYWCLTAAAAVTYLLKLYK